MKSTVECVFPHRGGVLRKTDTRYYGCKIKRKQNTGGGGGGIISKKNIWNMMAQKSLWLVFGFSNGIFTWKRIIWKNFYIGGVLSSIKRILSQNETSKAHNNKDSLYLHIPFLSRVHFLIIACEFKSTRHKKTIRKRELKRIKFFSIISLKPWIIMCLFIFLHYLQMLQNIENIIKIQHIKSS